MNNMPPRRSETVQYQELPEENELMIIDEANGQVRVLNGVAGGVWLLCDGKRSCAEMTELFRDLFPEKSPETVCTYLEDVLAFLRGEGLLK